MNQEPIKKMDSRDRISSLPDDILISIISLIPPAEATSTFTLSKNWFSLWNLVQERTLRLSLIPTAPTFVPFNFIQDLVLTNSRILNDEMLESVLSKFPALELFCLIGSLSVRNLTICCKKLKTLGISSCSKLKTLGLFTPELVTFIYDGPDIIFNFFNVPKLVEFSLAESYFYTLAKYDCLKIGLIREQLVKLNFGLRFPWKARYDLRGLFPGVRELRLYADFWFSNQQNILFFFYDLLKMAPNAEVVSMRLFWHEMHENSGTRRREFDHDWVGSSFHKVRVFELDGYTDFGTELDVLSVLFEAAAKKSLEKLVVRVGRRASIGRRHEDLMDDTEKRLVTLNAWEDIMQLIDKDGRGTYFELH